MDIKDFVKKIPGFGTEESDITIEDEIRSDIRTAPFEDTDFDISYTDSTCPINEAIAQVKEPGFDYIAAYNDPKRINSLLSKKWTFVDPGIMVNKPTFDIDDKYIDKITIGDTILMKRDSRYGAREQQIVRESNRSKMSSSLSRFKRSADPIIRIDNYENPFSN